MFSDHLPAVLDGLTEAVFLLDRSRQILFANRIARERFGLGLVGHNFVRAVRHPDCIRCIDEVLGGQPSSRVVIHVQDAAAMVYRVNVVGLEPKEADGVRAVVSIDDISHIHEAEQMRSDFVANVSHELRSPLTAITGFIETLRGPAKADAVARERFLAVMEQEANRLNRLIADLLSLSKVESNVRVRPTAPCDVVAAIRRVVTLLTIRAEELGKTIALEVISDASIVPGDEDELTQVFHNLIDNALKYSGAETTVEISITRIERDPGLRGAALAVAVRDRGPGIAQRHLSRLTQRFYRVDAGRSRDIGGTGLGLAIVKHIVTRHRGRLTITSEVGVGSVFTVHLPLTLSAG